MKIIFLDIDGVLNHQLWAEEQVYRLKRDDEEKLEYESRWFSPFSVGLLNHITDKTGAKIVVSSSWRRSRTVEELQVLFKRVGITGEVIDKTGRLEFTGIEGYEYSVPRGCEIKAWLELNKGLLGRKISKANYVILDDDSDMLLWQRENYFRVDPYCGLTPRLIERVINRLNREQ